MMMMMMTMMIGWPIYFLGEIYVETADPSDVNALSLFYLV